MKITERTFDATTGETTDVERTLTAKEKADKEAALAQIEADAKARAAKATEKAALLAKLGITDDEAKLLLS
jgi:plasmid replication initiation protein